MKRTVFTGFAFSFTLFMFMAVYTSGLFFDGDFYRFHLLLYAVTFASLVYLMITNMLTNKVTNMATKPAKAALFPSGIWLPFVMCLVYILPLFFSAVSIKGTFEQMMRWTSYGCFLWLVYHYARETSRRKHLHYVFQVTGLFIVFGAFGGLYGLIDFKDIVQYTKDERLSILGLRLAGFVQYANTFAVIIAAFLLYHLMALVKQQMRIPLFTAFPLVAYGTALLLTESRGVWLMLAVAWALGVFLLSSKERIVYILLSIITGIASLLVYQKLVQDLLEREAAYPGLLWLIIATVIVTGLAYYIVTGWDQSKRNRKLIHNKEYNHHIRAILQSRTFAILLPIILILIAIFLFSALLPNTIEKRATGSYETAHARALFYEDSLQIMKLSPWIGSGGDSWRQLFKQVQQQPYVGGEVHSGYLDMLLDTGIIGFAAFLCMLLYFAYKVGALRREMLPSLCLLFGHSVFDFDMSYGFFWLMAFWLIGVSLAEGESARVKGLWPKKKVPLETLAVLVLLLVSFMVAMRFEASRKSYEAALEVRSEPVKLELLQKSVRVNPYWTTSRVTLSRHVTLEQGIDLLQEGLKFEPQQSLLHWELGQLYAKQGEIDQATAAWEEAIRLDRYDNTKQEQRIRFLNQWAQELWREGRYKEAKAMAKKVVKAYEDYTELDNKVQALPHPANGRKFTVTEEAKLAAGQSYELLKRIQDKL